MSRRRGPSHERPSGWLLIAPSAWLYLLCFVVPISVIAVYSLGHKPPLESAATIDLSHPSLANFRDALSGTFLEIFEYTLWTASLGTLLCLVVGYPVAYWLATRCPEGWRAALVAAIVLPSWTSFLLRTFAWRIVLSANGPLSTWLQRASLVAEPLHVLDTRAAVQLGVVYNYLPLMILPLFVALDRLDPRLREASQDLGATPLQTFARVTWPLSLPGVLAGSMLVFIPLAGEYVTPAILGGARGTMAGGLLASQFLDAQNWPLGAAQAIVLVASIGGAISAGGLCRAVARTLAARARQG
ncbi:MAG: ABC transporter permease [Vicinamibacterales bacterium]